VNSRYSRSSAARAIVSALLLAACLLPFSAAATLPEGITYGDFPRWVDSVDADALAPAAASQGLAYRVVEDQVSLLDADPVAYRRLVYDIADRGGLEDGGRARVSFHPDYERVVVHALAVERGGVRFDRRTGSRVELLRLEERANDGILDGRRTAEFLMPDLQVGDRVELAYSVIGRNPVFGQGFHSSFYTNYSQAMAARRIRVVLPAGQSLSWKFVNGPGKFVESAVGGHRVLLLDLADVAAVEEEGALPSEFDPYGLVEISTARDWSEVADWSVALFRLGPPGQGALAGTARELDLAGRTPVDATREALAFVQREVRYVSLSIGESSHAPAAPDLTLERRFGDCKDKSLLMVGLLAEAGIVAEPVLVNTRLRAATRDRLASPLAFDHAIVRVKLDGQWVYFDPTRDTEVGEFEQRGPIRFGAGLPVSATATELVEIAMPALAEDGVVVTQDVKMVGDDGEERADVRVHTRYRYDGASQLRQRFRAESLDAIGKEYQDYMQRWHRDIELASALAFEDDPGTNTFEVSEHYLAPFMKDEDEPGAIGEFELNLFQLADWIPEAREIKRSQPLRLTGPDRGRQEIRMTLDGGWNIEAEAREIKNDYFRFRYHVSAKGDVLTVRGEWDRLAEAIPAEAYGQVRDDLREVRDLIGYSIQIGGSVGAGEGVVVGPRDLTWPLLALLLSAALLTAAWWLRRRSAIAGMFFAPRISAERLFERGNLAAALGALAASTTAGLTVGVLPELVAGHRPDWTSLGWEVLSALPQTLISVGLLYGLYRLLGSRPGYRNLFIASCWALWPLTLLLPLALLAGGPALSILADEPATIASGAPMGWLLVIIMLLMVVVACGWTLVSSVVAHTVAAGCSIGRTIGVYCLALLVLFALLFVGILAYVFITGALPGA
jgi:hypothetical protein